MKISVEETNGKKRYSVNDVVYERLEDVPAQYQHFFADANQNGVPDHVDEIFEKANPINILKNLFKDIGGRSRSNLKDNEDPPKRETYNRGGGESSWMPSLIKILVGIVFGILIVWGYQTYFQSGEDTTGAEGDEYVEGDSAPVDDPRDPVDDETSNGSLGANPESPLTIALEDPDVRPYHVFISVSEGDQVLFTMEPPQMSLSDISSNTELQFTGEAEGTNLSSKANTFSVSSTSCDLNDSEMEWSKVNIGSLEFNKGVGGGNGAGQTYITNVYSFERNGHCISFVLSMQLGNAAAFDPPVQEFDTDQEIRKLENLLATIKFK